MWLCDRTDWPNLHPAPSQEPTQSQAVEHISTCTPPTSHSHSGPSAPPPPRPCPYWKNPRSPLPLPPRLELAHSVEHARLGVREEERRYDKGGEERREGMGVRCWRRERGTPGEGHAFFGGLARDAATEIITPRGSAASPLRHRPRQGWFWIKKLTFRNHVELAQRRGTKAVLARISSPSFGLRPATLPGCRLPVQRSPSCRRAGTRSRTSPALWMRCSRRSSMRHFLAMEERRKERNRVLCFHCLFPLTTHHYDHTSLLSLGETLPAVKVGFSVRSPWYWMDWMYWFEVPAPHPPPLARGSISPVLCASGHTAVAAMLVADRPLPSRALQTIFNSDRGGSSVQGHREN
ncbi:hypothetical protein DFH08DRAFT_1047158 [Mycena albidolilacea]|uniref:Uncharacterized protein n=1 Tax=Mycena albidolilacea TaxID=1033008 RepID=A0AAD7EZK3_9AGAR|nr:hypothetical protein DFH08DRAFT_1047158 [Mycena albidolilacea]